MSIKLSICIPTYNRAAFIGQTIESIIDQATDEVEIVISDNASQDNTEQIIRSYYHKFPRITYFRWDKNMGADRNYLKVVELAQGEFCWLMGSDDKVEEGGIETILSALKKHQGITGISVNVEGYDYSLRNKIRISPPVVFSDDKHFETAESCFSALGAWFGYISAQIVERKIWNEVVTEKHLEPYFNAYVHIYIISNLLLRKPNWLYLHAKCVGWRTGNDSFLSEGRFKRLAIDILGYEKIARDVFGKFSKPYNDLMKIVSTTHVKIQIIAPKYNNVSQSFYFKAFPLCVQTYWPYPCFWIKTFPHLFIYSIVPNFLFNGVRRIWGCTLKKPFYSYIRKRSRNIA